MPLLPLTRSLSSPSYGLRATRAGRGAAYAMTRPVRFFHFIAGARKMRSYA